MKWMALAAAAVCSTLGISDARLVVVNEDSDSITIIENRATVAEIPVCERPRTVSVDAGRAFTVCADGQINRIDLDTLRVDAAAVGGVEPFGVLASGDRVYVSDHGARAVRVLDANTLQTIASIETEEYPRGLALDGGKLYVTHFRSGRVTVIDTGTLQVTKVISTGADANLSQSIAIANGRAYLPQTRSNTSNRALLFDNTVFPVVTVVDLATGNLLTRERISFDIVDQPVNLPFDAAVTSGGKIYVVHAGSDDLSAIKLDFQQTVAHLDLGSNPRGLALSKDEKTLYVNNALSGTVSVIDTATDTVVDTIKSTTIPLAPNLLRGKLLFNSSSNRALSKDAWISCATCHFEGGADGRTWFFRDGLRNTPALFGVASTLPMHWSGDLDELQDVESTIRTVQAGTGLIAGDDPHCTPACDEPRLNAGRSQELDDLAIFMATLRAPRRKVTATKSGEALFATHCASCHPAPLYTDRRKHDVRTGSEFERKGTSFDTPSLRGVFDSAPYLHDGSAATIKEAIARHVTVPEQDAEEIARFVEGLDFPRPRRRAIR